MSKRKPATRRRAEDIIARAEGNAVLLSMISAHTIVDIGNVRHYDQEVLDMVIEKLRARSKDLEERLAKDDEARTQG